MQTSIRVRTQSSQNVQEATEVNEFSAINRGNTKPNQRSLLTASPVIKTLCFLDREEDPKEGGLLREARAPCCCERVTVDRTGQLPRGRSRTGDVKADLPRCLLPRWRAGPPRDRRWLSRTPDLSCQQPATGGRVGEADASTGPCRHCREIRGCPFRNSPWDCCF